MKQDLRVVEDEFAKEGEEVAVLIGKNIFGGGKFENFVLLRDLNVCSWTVDFTVINGEYFESLC